MFYLSIDRNSPIPLYYQIQEWIRSMIASGTLKPGDMLPNEIILSEQIGVSRMTVRQALNQLTNEGILTRQRAKGTFVAPPRSSLPFVREQVRSLTEELAIRGKVLRSRVLALKAIPAVGEVQHTLGLQPGEQVIYIRRLRYSEDGPVSIETAHHPYRRFPGLVDMDLTDRSIYEILDQQYGARPVEATDTFAAGTATSEEARLLEIDPSIPVMHFTRIAQDTNGQVMEFTRAIYRADRYQFVIHYPRPNSKG
jgi:GntR family transcriptional regulator